MPLTYSSSNRMIKDMVPRGLYQSETAGNGLRNELPVKQYKINMDQKATVITNFCSKAWCETEGIEASESHTRDLWLSL